MNDNDDFVIFVFMVLFGNHRLLFWSFRTVPTPAGLRPILCLTSRTTVASGRIPGEDACYRARNLCVISRVQKGTPRFTHKGCVLQRVSLGALSDVTVILWMRQSINNNLWFRNKSMKTHSLFSNSLHVLLMTCSFKSNVLSHSISINKTDI